MYFHTSSDRHRLIVDNLIKSVIVIVRSTRTVADIRWSSCDRNRLSKTIDDHRTVETRLSTISTRHRHRAVGISRTHNANRMLPIVQIRVQNSTHSSNRKQKRGKRQFQNYGMSCITPVSSSYFVGVRACVRSAASARRRTGQSEGYEICDHLLLCRTDPWVTSHGGNEFHVCIGAYLFVKCFQKISVHFASFVLFLRHVFANFFPIIHYGHTFVGPGDRRERGLRFVRILGSEISPIPLAVVSFRLMRRFSNHWKKTFL
jgi:hypothetical protein